MHPKIPPYPRLNSSPRPNKPSPHGRAYSVQQGAPSLRKRATGTSLMWCTGGGRWTYAKNDQDPGSLYLQGGNFENNRLDVHESKKALGIRIRPDRKMLDEAKFLKKKAIRWSDALRTNRIKPSQAWCCLNSTIMKKIEYPLVATTLSRKQIDDIMRPILRGALNKCAIQKNIPRKLLYGNLRARGFNLKDPFLTQLIAHLQSILRHCHRASHTL